MTKRRLFHIAESALDCAEYFQMETFSLNNENKELKAQLNAAKEMNTENLRLLDSYMQNNSRQAQDIIELEAVAIALYDYVWHHVHSVEDELKNHEGVTELNAYKTIKALFEAGGDE